MTRRSTHLLVTAAAVLFCVAAALPSTALFDSTVRGDGLLYHTYGSHIVHGDVPYHDFFMEYPPGAIPAFVAATPASGTRAYDQLFKLLMLACTLGCLVLAAVALRHVGASRERMVLALAAIALAPVLFGSNLTTHYDPWPALLTTLAIVLLLTGRRTWAFVALGVAVAAKVFPLVILPIALVYVLRRRGRGEAKRGALVFAGTLGVCLLPFAAVGAGGLRYTFEFQTRRPLQLESLGAGLLLAAHHLGIYTAHPVSSFNSTNLAGSLAHVVGTATTLVIVLVLVAVWVMFARGSADDEALLTGCAAAIVAYVALGKILSPQYLAWLIPVVPLVAGPAGVIASVLLGVALVLTQLLLQYSDGIGLSSADWVVLARDLLLVAMLAVLVVALRRPRADAPGAFGRT